MPSHLATVGTRNCLKGEILQGGGEGEEELQIEGEVHPRVLFRRNCPVSATGILSSASPP